jgi:hypothetical protein
VQRLAFVELAGDLAPVRRIGQVAGGVIVRRSAPYSFNAAARAFCRLEADSLPASRDAVACPNFSDPASLSRSSQCPATRSMLHRLVSSGPASGNVEAASAFGVIR